MKEFEILKNNLPCKECITFPICKNELDNSLNEQGYAYSNSMHYSNTLYYCAFKCFYYKCSLYKNYLMLCNANYSKSGNFHYFEDLISPIIVKVFKIKKEWNNGKN